MELKDLYLAGINFEAFIGTGIKSERDRIPKNYSRVILNEKQIAIIENCEKNINFLISGETWCTDFQLNVTVLKKICELNKNFQMAIITKGRGEKYLKPILNLDDFKVPVIVPLNENLQLCGEIFIERPKSIKTLIYEDIKMDYLKGRYLNDTINELINIIEKITL